VTDELLVHGMGTELVSPDWPALRLPELTGLLAGYGLTARRVTWRSPRPLSAAALVETDAGTVFVKRHPAAVRTVEGLAEEHAFAGHLRRRGVPVPEVLADRDGRTATGDRSWTWEVHAGGAGADSYRDVPSWQPFHSAGDAYAAGAALARLSLAAGDFTAPARRPQLLVAGWRTVSSPDLLTGLRSYVGARPAVADALAGRNWEQEVVTALQPLHARLAPQVAGLPPGWTHGDGHASNFLWSPDGQVTAVLDLGLADLTTPMFDLATAIERSCISWLSASPAGRLDLVDALLAGWRSVLPLTDVEAAALPELVALAHVDFALSELGYFAGVTRSAQNAELAYDGYLLGHARWFTGPDGTALREHLRAAATPTTPS
jgi:Ser/Thr protein kinase RdoA (MazF antagonist)